MGLLDDLIMAKLAQRFGPMTARTQAGRPNHELRNVDPTVAERVGQGLLDYGPIPAKGVVEQFTETAPNALVEAANDPSIPNITNAGVQTAVAMGRAIPALGILTAGYGAAGAKDLGLLSFGTAQAQGKGKQQAPQQFPNGFTRADLEPIAQATGMSIETLAAMRRGQVQQLLVDVGSRKVATEADAETRRREQEQQEFNAAVERADAARDTILADRPKRFNETTTGQLYDKTGIMTPLLLATVAGGLSRLPGGGKSSAMRDHVIPTATGAATGVAAANYPLGHELMFAPAANPERKAYEAYARELPPTHPRKQEWTEYARGLPTSNPDREAASKEFYDPVKFAERSGLGLLEGILGGHAGSDIIRTGGRIRDKLFGAKRETPPPPPPDRPPPQDGPLSARANPDGKYPPVGSAGRQYIRDEYIDAVNRQGGPLDASKASKIIQAEAVKQGGSLPSTTRQINATQRELEAFVSAHGRLPTRKEWDQFILRNTGTLGIAGGGLLGLSAVQDEPSLGGLLAP